MDIAAAMAQVSVGLNAIKQIYDAGHEFDKAQLKLKAAELIGALTQAKLTLSEAQDELRGKDKEIAALKEAFRRTTDGMVRERGHLYEKGKEDAPVGLPYCNTCLELDGVLVRAVNGKGPDVKCPRCKTDFRASDYGWE